MGVPTTANYIITSTIAAPALLQLGVIPIAAHLFVFYFGIIADLTPPVALAAYAGAAIARGNPFKTGVTATRLAIGAFILPYIFVTAPQLLLVQASPLGLVLAVVTSLIGMTAISAGLTGFLVKKLHWVERILLVGAGLLLVDPRPRDGPHRNRRPGRHRRVPGSRAGEEGGGMKANRLSLRTKLGFGVCDVGGNLFVTIMGFYALNFITDVALLSATLAGTALLVGKIWDAIIDPAIGFLSDRTKSRLGRRRPWMLGGAISVVFFMILMYTNPHIQSQGWLVRLGDRRVLPARHRLLGDQHSLRRAHPRADLGLRRADLPERLPDELRRDRDLRRRRGPVHRRHVRQQGHRLDGHGSGDGPRDLRHGADHLLLDQGARARCRGGDRAGGLPEDLLGGPEEPPLRARSRDLRAAHGGHQRGAGRPDLLLQVHLRGRGIRPARPDALPPHVARLHSRLDSRLEADREEIRVQPRHGPVRDRA